MAWQTAREQKQVSLLKVLCWFQVDVAYGCERKAERREPRTEGALLAVVVLVAQLAQLARIVARLQVGARVQ